MFKWSGQGWFVAVVAIAAGALVQLAVQSATGDKNVYAQSVWAIPLAFIVAAGSTFALDRLLFTNTRDQHTMFFIPVKWWAPIFAVTGVVIFVYRLVDGIA